MALHNNELDVDDDLVRQLLSDQMPDWSGLPSRWTVLEWIGGTTASPAGLNNLDATAVALGEFVAELKGLFDGDSRETLRAALDPSAGDWERAKGWALHMAVLAIAYYAGTNAGFVEQARRALREILDDH